MIQLSNSLRSEESSEATSKESIKENEEIFSMKHKKIRTATTSTSTNKKSTTQSKEKSKATVSTANTNLKAKAKATTTTATANKNTNLNKNTNTNAIKNTNKNASTNKNKQDFTDNLYGANSDLLKQTGLLDAAYEANNQKNPGHKDKLDLEKMGPIAFQSWVRFFKYTDQVARDREARLRFNQNRKFFVNPEFREQLKYYPGENYQEKDADGEHKYVATPNDFYLIAFKSSVVFFESKIVNKKIKF